MEEALQPQEYDQARTTNHFALAIGASLVLHVVLSLILIGLPAGPSTRQAVTYIDLTMPQHAAPMTVPAPAPQAQAAAVPEDEPAPEKAAVTEAPPQSAEAKPAQDLSAAPPEVKPEEERSLTTLGMGLTKGYFNSLGEGETLRTGVKEYYLAMLQQINEKWWLDEQLDKKKVSPVIINLIVARNGEILASQVMMSSGNRSYDKAVVAALTAASPLPPLPPDYQGDFFQAPVRLVPPLNLMAW